MHHVILLSHTLSLFLSYPPPSLVSITSSCPVTDACKSILRHIFHSRFSLLFHLLSHTNKHISTHSAVSVLARHPNSLLSFPSCTETSPVKRCQWASFLNISLFVVGSLLFLAGSIFFHPIYSVTLTLYEIGVIEFVAGSLLFTVGELQTCLPLLSQCVQNTRRRNDHDGHDAKDARVASQSHPSPKETHGEGDLSIDTDSTREVVLEYGFVPSYYHLHTHEQSLILAYSHTCTLNYMQVLQGRQMCRIPIALL